MSHIYAPQHISALLHIK